MSNIGLSTDLVLANTSVRPGTLVLPLSTQIPGRTITIKDSVGAAAVSSIYISTSGGDTFEDGSTTQALTTSYGFMKVTASAPLRKWFMGETTQPSYYTASTIKAATTQAITISTATMNVSSLSLLTDPVTPFTPRSIPGCVLWLDGKDVNGTGSNITAGTTMTQWIDKSGGGNSTTSKTGTITMTSNAIGSNAAPYFPNNPSYFVGSLPTYTGTAIYHFAVATLTTSATAYGRILGLARTGTNDFGDSTTEFAFIRNNATQGLLIGRNSSYLGITIPAYSTPFIVQSSQNGSTESIGLNGTFTPATQNTGISTGFNISAYGIGTNPITTDGGGWYDGVIAEVVVYMGTVLTTAQIQSMEGYLAQKWGLTALLPAGHPGSTTQLYKTNDYVAPSTQSFYVSSSLAYWGPYLLNSGFRTAQPQIFFALAKLMSSIYSLSSYSLTTLANSVSTGSSTPVYIWTASVPPAARGKNGLLAFFFNLYSSGGYLSGQYFDYGVYIDGVSQFIGDGSTMHYIQTTTSSYALSSNGTILGTNGITGGLPLLFPLAIGPSASIIQLGISNSSMQLTMLSSQTIGYSSNVFTSSGSGATLIPQNTFTTVGSNIYTVPTNTSVGTPVGVYIYCWGAGGAATNSIGGPGGFVSGYYPATPGTNLIYVVGRAGQSGIAPSLSNGNGGQSGSGTTSGGGGFSGVFLSNAGGIVQSNAIAIAGGGGGGGQVNATTGGYGGYPSGGAQFLVGSSSQSSNVTGGTQTSGGITYVTNNGTSVGGGQVASNAGSALLGGPGTTYGGGGGGGWFGGAGGNDASLYVAGGGGSGYIGNVNGATGGIGMTNATYSNGSSALSGSTTPGYTVAPGGTGSIFYTSTYGQNAQSGLIVIVPVIGTAVTQVGVTATLFTA